MPRNRSPAAIRSVANEDWSKPTPPGNVPRDAIPFNGNWYAFSTKKLKFQEAVVLATRAGGRVAVVWRSFAAKPNMIS